MPGDKGAGLRFVNTVVTIVTWSRDDIVRSWFSVVFAVVAHLLLRCMEREGAIEMATEDGR